MRIIFPAPSVIRQSLALLLAVCLAVPSFLVAADRRFDPSTQSGTPAVNRTVAGDRIALLIGNSEYDEAPLANPLNDVQAFAAALKEIGFEVIVRQNATHRDMDEAISEFWNLLKGKSVGLFYYSGHGLQVNGENYLVPIKASLKTEIDIRHECYGAQKVLDYMQDAQPRLSLIILDACRNNPFKRSIRAVQRGLAAMNAGRQVMLAYATDPNNVAQDGDPNGNSPYMKHVLRHLRNPGLPIEKFFKEVRKGVLQDTKGEQTPWESGNLTDEFSFVPGTEEKAPATTGIASEPVINRWIETANQGKKEAMFIVGNAFEFGLMDNAIDLTQAAYWYRKGAEANNPAAMHSLGQLYLEGKGVDRNRTEGWKWIEKAAAAGETYAQKDLNEHRQQQQELEAAAKNGSIRAQFELYRQTYDLSPVPAAQESFLREKAEQGDEQAKSLLIYLYMQEVEVGTMADRKKWLTLSAEKASPQHLFHLAYMQENGRGLPVDFEMAASYYRQARDNGHPDADAIKSRLQDLYDSGKADPQEDAGLTKTLDGLKTKAQGGDAKAQTELAVKMAKGEGTTIDIDGAVVWIKKAAAQNYPPALTSLGQLQLGGEAGVAKNADAGVKLLVQAAEAGHAEAAVTLMKWHQNTGKGASGDIEALAWAYILVKRSEKMGELAWAYRDAGNFHIEKLTGKLSAGQNNQARRRMNELAKAIPGFKDF